MDFAAHLMAANELINIREMSKRSSVPAATLRYYERLGLITSERETSGGHRRYSEATLHRITYITLAQRVGFSLEEIAEQLAMLPNIHPLPPKVWEDRKSTRLNSSHRCISYAVFCLKKKKKHKKKTRPITHITK